MEMAERCPPGWLRDCIRAFPARWELYLARAKSRSSPVIREFPMRQAKGSLIDETKSGVLNKEWSGGAETYERRRIKRSDRVAGQTVYRKNYESPSAR